MSLVIDIFIYTLAALGLLFVALLAAFSGTKRGGSQPTIPANPLPPPPAPRYIARKDEGTAYKPTSNPTTPAPWGAHGPTGGDV